MMENHSSASLFLSPPNYTLFALNMDAGSMPLIKLLVFNLGGAPRVGIILF